MSEDKDARSRRWFLRGGLGVTAGAITATLPRGVRAESPVDVGVEPVAAPPMAPGQTSLAVKTEINGLHKTLQSGPDTVALEALRDQLGLRAAKRSCGHGACGACTVHLDGVPVASCLLPATALEGRSVRTLESFGEDASHPVQRAFLAEDALQCGFCTPGFVMEAIAFYDAWRSAHPNGTEPTVAQVADAMEGHLCRCGAYVAITRAVQRACRGDFEQPGGPRPRRDGPDKVTGRARYTVDVALPRQVEAVMLRSPHASATLDSVDLSAAQALPGYLGVHMLTPLGASLRFAGQEVLAVAAETAHQARAAARAIRVGYTTHPSVVTPKAARAEDAPLVYPGSKRLKDLPNASESPAFGAPWNGNVRGPFALISHNGPLAATRLRDGRRAAGVEGEPGDAVIVANLPDGRAIAERTFTTQVQVHTALEPHATVASWAVDELTVYLSTQAVWDMAADIAQHFELPRSAVRVVAEHVGGGFGAKCALFPDTIAAVELSRALGRPVRVALERHEEMTVGGLRPGAEMRVGVMSDADGALHAIEADAYHDAGVSIGSSVGFLWRILYPHAPKKLSDYDVVSHGPPGAPFRGPGGPAAFYAVESLVDGIAELRSESPIALRQRWDPNPFRQELYEKAAVSPLWGRRRGRADGGRHRRGVGLAVGSWLEFVTPRTQVEVEAGPDGVLVRCGTQDMGQGSRTVLATSVGELFGMDVQDVQVQLGDSRFVRGPGSNGSRTTASVVPAAEMAARAVQEDLAEFAAARFKLRDAAPRTSGVGHADGVMPWAEVLAAAPTTRAVGKRKPDRGGYFLPEIMGTATGKVLSGSVQLAEVEVDTRTGVVRVVGWWGGFGVGRIVAPALARSQAIGGITQGISYTLYEDRRLDPGTGRLLSAGLEDYRVAGIGDIPDIEIVFADLELPKVRGGAVGIAEIVTVAAPGAIANAVYDATGWRPDRLPLRPDLVLAGMGA